ncbi:hypothetical protein ACNOYE_15470 [Nannocystaceae bacterium ST9]
MPKLKTSEMQVVEDAFITGGYVLEFSNRTFQAFFEDEFDVQIYSDKYGYRGPSKGSHLRAFVETESGPIAAQVLRALWVHFEETTTTDVLAKEKTIKLKTRLFGLISKLEANQPQLPTPTRTWSREEQALLDSWTARLNTLTEDELIELVLCPLFGRLHFQRITPTGHEDKALEYGKDLWMRYRLPTGHFLYFGIQAKRGKLDAAGRSKNSNIGEVYNQVCMMLGHPIFDPETNKKHLVDHAIIACGGEITKQARNWLGEKLDASRRSQILFMDRKDILDLVTIHKIDLPE